MLYQPPLEIHHSNQSRRKHEVVSYHIKLNLYNSWSDRKALAKTFLVPRWAAWGSKCLYFRKPKCFILQDGESAAERPPSWGPPRAMHIVALGAGSAWGKENFFLFSLGDKVTFREFLWADGLGLLCGTSMVVRGMAKAKWFFWWTEILLCHWAKTHSWLFLESWLKLL